jgi:hypothetical protein
VIGRRRVELKQVITLFCFRMQLRVFDAPSCQKEKSVSQSVSRNGSAAVYLVVAAGICLARQRATGKAFLKLAAADEQPTVSHLHLCSVSLMDGPGMESRWGRDFPHPSRPVPGPTPPPIQWVPSLSRGKGAGAGR